LVVFEINKKIYKIKKNKTLCVKAVNKVLPFLGNDNNTFGDNRKNKKEDKNKNPSFIMTIYILLHNKICITCDLFISHYIRTVGRKSRAVEVRIRKNIVAAFVD